MELYDEQYEVCPFCGFVNGSAGKSATHLKPGTMIHGRYLVGTAIGQGGFGITYVGWDTVLRQKIAIKEYYPTSMANRSGNSGDVYAINAKSQKGYDKGVDKFLAEARTVAQFNKQDEIVHVYDYLKENNTAYIIMEYIEGETLKSKMSKNPDKLYTSVEIANVIRPVILALRTIHCAGVIHRDISPDNIMVTDDGQIKILDFGAAREFSADNAQNMSVILKAGYAPPEQFSKTGHQDPRTDIYALGAVLYRLTTGKMPESSLDRRAKDELVKPRKLNKNMPVWLEKTILKCLALNPEDRFENAEDLLEAFNEREDYFAAREKKSRKGTFIIVALLAVALFSGLGVYFSTDGSKENGFVDTIKGVDGSAEIIESGFLYDEPTGDIFAGVIIENNGDTELMGSSTILLEAKDKNGEVMTSEAFTLECNVYAGDTIGIPFTMYEACDKKPASLEASLSGANYQNQPEYKPLEV
ncbi:MAG: serine/threonine-protein kinase [Bacillota bacterium]|nr:serine/threonine-protein kinase [Bacillota bacterium]